MKTSFWLLATVLFVHAGTCLAKGVDGAERGGGDPIALEFTRYGSAIAQDLETWRTKILTPEIRRDFSKAIQEFPIVPIDGEVLDSNGISMTAVTDLAKKQIEVSRKRWTNLGYLEEFQKIAVVFHEYLRAAGYSSFENTYALTGKFLAYVKTHSSAMHSTAVHVNQVQMQRLATMLRGRTLVCVPNGGSDPRSFHITASKSTQGDLNVEIRYSNGTHYLTQSKTKPFGTVTQIAAGESVLVSFGGDSARDVLRFDSPTKKGSCSCGFGTESYAAPPKAEPQVRTIKCCLLP